MQDKIQELRENITKVFLGNEGAVDRLICCLLSRGHALIEDVPGVGKTVLATALARSIDCAFTRIQLTPDLLPGDVLGVSVLDKATGEFVLKKGPVFTNILLADEINRTTPRTQTALLEAMSEQQVSVDGRVIPLEPPFMVLATQNPYEFEGTYLLPENQLDRFLMRIELGYPSAEDELRVLEIRPAQRVLAELKPVLNRAEVIDLQNQVDAVKVDRAILDYIVRIADATRNHPSIRVGLSPRGSLALAQASRATAMIHNRDYVIPEDVLENLTDIAAHRLIFTAGGHPDAEEAKALLDSIAAGVGSPA
ncbi:MAG: MoxR family ATPase [Phycisphaerales bacterium]|nr:MAG: MoxR family ATPase [Phycisphaerales bacterium]